jgi:hypothetical protein
MDECVVELMDSMGWLPEFFGSPNNDGQGPAAHHETD